VIADTRIFAQQSLSGPSGVFSKPFVDEQNLKRAGEQSEISKQ
jgi:hypothetical protein